MTSNAGAHGRFDKADFAYEAGTRSMTVEHPFGTIKTWMGATHFRTRRLKNGATEMALHVLAYNLTRVMKIIGIAAFVAAMRA